MRAVLPKSADAVKLTIIGGGGCRVPMVYEAVARDTRRSHIDEVALYDPSQERLEVIGHVLRQLAKDMVAPPVVHTFTDLQAALQGSDFVFLAIRVGGLSGRVCDERVALGLGVLGQETTGPGGIAYGLRTVPVALRIAEIVRSVCPDAYVINFTNPAGIITEAMATILGDRVVGVCDSPRGLGRRLAIALELDPDSVEFDYVGLNHLGWVRRVMHDGRDHLPALLADESALRTLVEEQVFGVSWLQALGAVPNEYLFYYYCNREAVRAIKDQGETRGEYLIKQQSDFYAAAAERPERAYELWDQARSDRNDRYMAEARGRDAPRISAGSGGGYEGVALGVIEAIAGDKATTMILNTRNRGALAGFDDDAVVEIPCAVDARGVRPIPTSPADLHQTGLMQQVKAVERLTIEAASTRSKVAALKAFALHPLVGSLSIARELLDGYVDAVPEIAAVFDGS